MARTQVLRCQYHGFETHGISLDFCCYRNSSKTPSIQLPLGPQQQAAQHIFHAACQATTAQTTIDCSMPQVAVSIPSVCFYLAVAFIFTLVATSAFMLTLVFSVTIVKFIAQVTASLLDCANEMNLTARQSHYDK